MKTKLSSFIHSNLFGYLLITLSLIITITVMERLSEDVRKGIE